MAACRSAMVPWGTVELRRGGGTTGVQSPLELCQGGGAAGVESSRHRSSVEVEA
jgi:hypothetical protein